MKAIKRKKLEQFEEESKKMQFKPIVISSLKNRVFMANFSEEQLNRIRNVSNIGISKIQDGKSNIT